MRASPDLSRKDQLCHADRLCAGPAHRGPGAAVYPARRGNMVELIVLSEAD
jgi:hypothetical protein